MVDPRRVAFDGLGDADLCIDTIYEGGGYGDLRDDPLAHLVGGGNQGGFRYLGSANPFGVRQCVLYSDLMDLDWPDRLDVESGQVTYYGDNKTPGGDLHGTRRQGNVILREMFLRTHARTREEIPPVFVFTKGGAGREVVFRGLAVPGAPDMGPMDDLVAIWKSKRGHRFQNYRATFTILDVAVVARAWLQEIVAGEIAGKHAPAVWLAWRKSGVIRPLRAQRARSYRTPAEQLPAEKSDLRLLEQVVKYYHAHKDGPYAFERCAAELFRLMQPGVHSIELTRPWRDGGRDALGLCRIGTSPSSIDVEFALEAKCKAPSAGNSSGVREVSRLIARIRHRQFGVFVTTSCVGTQAYKEIVEDSHPVAIIAGSDIVRVLKRHGLATPTTLGTWMVGLEVHSDTQAPSPD
jgi:hypothetical protein